MRSDIYRLLCPPVCSSDMLADCLSHLGALVFFFFSALPSVYYAIKIFDAAKADGGHIKNDGAPQPYLVTIQPELETYGKVKFLEKKSVGHVIHIIGKLRKMKLIVVFFFVMQPPREESNQKF